MSDFDAVLERLVSDAGFQAALAADPQRALAGYELSPDERELLNAQLSGDLGGERGVETRTSKAGMFGMFGPLTEAVGLGHAAQSAGSGPGEAGFGQTGAGEPHVAYGQAGAWQPVPEEGGVAQFRQAAEGALPDYHPQIDVNGDGLWDEYTVVARTDGGVDLVADVDHDGRADFIGHDDNRDGLIDAADYDKNGDGRFETHMADADGDGWLDSSTTDQPPASGTAPAPPA